jgi:hypothetical protein
MVDVTGSILLTLLRFSGVQHVDQLESFCNRYGYSPNQALTDMIKVYMDAVGKFEQQKAEEQLGVKPKVTVGVNV